MKTILLVLTLLAGGVVPSLAQAACTPVTVLPATISAPGNYCLEANLAVNMDSGTALNIAASDVVLDCQEHSITNNAVASTGTANAIGINGRNTVTVRNCRIFGGFASGIWAVQNNAVANANSYLTLADNYISGMKWYGILAYGNAIEIRDNRIHDIGGRPNTFAMGVRVAGSSVAGQPRLHIVRHNLISGIRSPDNNGYGIYSDNSLSGIFTDNSITGTHADNTIYRGYALRINGTSNRITANHIVGSAAPNDTGIYAAGTDHLCFDNYIHAVVQVTAGCDASLGNY